MTEQPTALWLADAISKNKMTLSLECAAELRRLSAVEAQRDALLNALKILVLATKDVSVGHYNEEVHDIALSTARAVIKAVEGEKT